MTKKFDDFAAELEKLCEKHDVHIAPSMYDTIDVWDKQDWNKSYVDHLNDETKETDSTTEGKL